MKIFKFANTYRPTPAYYYFEVEGKVRMFLPREKRVTGTLDVEMETFVSVFKLGQEYIFLEEDSEEYLAVYKEIVTTLL